jgi:hypothetical protein
MDCEIETKYNFLLHIQYNNNLEYRKVLRDLFFMKEQDVDEDLDEETKDELNYNESSISTTMDSLLLLTKDNRCFQELYDLAAALMFSCNREIGLAVLFSYDNLPLFHDCLSSFYYDPGAFNELNLIFISLKQKLI